MDNYVAAAFLGVVEGLTEFLPVSSTGHLILFADLIGFKVPSAKTFEVVIQLGAILAVVLLYFRKLWGTLIGLPTDPSARKFALSILIAFLPAAVLGGALHGFIKEHLFSPLVVASAFIFGGIIILLVEAKQRNIYYKKADHIPLRTSFLIGVGQTFALIPGMSRSGATIIAGLLLGLERRAAAEFSFFLAIPTMLGAFVYDLYKNKDALSFDDAGLIAIGFVAAFLSALLVIKPFLSVVGRIGFSPFAYYRIAMGVVILSLAYLNIGWA